MKPTNSSILYRAFLLFSFSILDYLSTLLALSLGAVEVNPFINFMLGFPLAVLVIKLLLCIPAAFNRKATTVLASSLLYVTVMNLLNVLFKYTVNLL